MDDIEIFSELGLTRNEARVYETLLELGKMGAGDVSSKSGVSYSRIYDVLESLVNKGLVNIVPEKSKKFIPANPERFEELLDKKRKLLDEAREKVKAMKGFYDVKEKNPVKVVFGRKAFYKILAELRDPQEKVYTIKWSSEFRPDWARRMESRKRKKVDEKILARYDKSTKEDVCEWIKINKNIRKIENEGVALSVVDDVEVMIALIKSNVTIVIEDPALAKIMNKMFLNTYNLAENIDNKKT